MDGRHRIRWVRRRIAAWRLAARDDGAAAALCAGGRTGGATATGDVRALHECDVTLCVRVVGAEEIAAGVRATAGTQQENMEQMAARGRGGGRPRVDIARGAGSAGPDASVRWRCGRRCGQGGTRPQWEAAMLGGEPRVVVTGNGFQAFDGCRVRLCTRRRLHGESHRQSSELCE